MKTFLTHLSWIGLCAFASPLTLHATTLSGTVTNDATGFPVQAADIDVFDSNGLSVPIIDVDTGGTAATRLDGTFHIELPGPGTYTFRIDLPSTAPLADRYYGNVFLKSEATPVSVAEGENVVGLDVQLVPGVTLSGSILSGGFLLPFVDIDVYEATTGEFMGSYPAESNASGTYLVGALPPGSYLIKADPDPALPQYQVPEFYGGGPDKASAQPIVVGTSPVSGINFNLAPGGVITGIITGSDTSLPLDGIDLDIYDALGNRVPFNDSSEVDGSYFMGPLPPGTYILRADPSLIEGHVRAYHSTTVPNTFHEEESTLITVVAGQTITAINFQLDPAGSISGSVRDTTTLLGLPGIDLDIFDAIGNRVFVTARTDAAGNYQLGPLPQGQYFLRADPSATAGYAELYWQSAPDLLTADPITVLASQNTPAINFALSPAGYITGTVQTPDNVPLANIDIDVFDSATGNRIRGNAVTGLDGSYVFGPILPGTYTIRCDPTPTQQYAMEYFQGQVNKALANLVTVAPKTPSIADFVLERGGSISGQLIDRTTGAMLSGVDIDVFDAATGIRLDQSSKTDLSGNWMVGPLPTGSYILRADVPPESPLSDIYSGNVRFSGDAVPLTVLAGVDQTIGPLALPPDIVVPFPSIALGANGASALNMETIPGLIYQIEYTNDLQGSWTVLQTITGDGTPISFPVPSLFGTGFFRVQIN